MISEFGAEVASQNAVGEIGEVLNLLLIYEIVKFVDAFLDFCLDFFGFSLSLLLLVVKVCDITQLLAHDSGRPAIRALEI